MGWGTNLPVYVTRKTASGETASYSLAFWITFPIMVLAAANAFTWGVLGLYFAAKVVV